MENKIKERIKNVMSAVFELPVEQIKDDSSPDTIESWDSLKHMNLVVALEEEFETEFNDDEIMEMMNYKLIVEVIE
jgi:acyl carrier protein